MGWGTKKEKAAELSVKPLSPTSTIPVSHSTVCYPSAMQQAGGATPPTKAKAKFLTAYKNGCVERSNIVAGLPPDLTRWEVKVTSRRTAAARHEPKVS